MKKGGMTVTVAEAPISKFFYHSINKSQTSFPTYFFHMDTVVEHVIRRCPFWPKLIRRSDAQITPDEWSQWFSLVRDQPPTFGVDVKYLEHTPCNTGYYLCRLCSDRVGFRQIQHIGQHILLDALNQFYGHPFLVGPRTDQVWYQDRLLNLPQIGPTLRARQRQQLVTMLAWKESPFKLLDRHIVSLIWSLWVWVYT
jgi:hypothetical protein